MFEEFSYRKVGLEDLVLPVLHLAVLLAGRLLHAVLVVRAEQHTHLNYIEMLVNQRNG
jgi:hypothetical protein